MKMAKAWGTTRKSSVSRGCRTKHSTTMLLTFAIFSLTAKIGVSNLCNPDNPIFSLAPVPACRQYVLCLRGLVLMELTCPSHTAFDPQSHSCSPKVYERCRVQETIGQVQTRVTCPRGQTAVTYYPDYSHDCPSPLYYRCQDGLLSHQTCAHGQVFDEGIDACVTSAGFNCGVTGPECTVAAHQTAMYANYTLGCPARQFVRCYEGGKGVGVACPEGLFYNGAVKNCDYPNNIVCGDNVPDASRLTFK